MSAISSCPQCGKQVTIPSGVATSAKVRCPLCDSQYTLADALVNMPPLLELIDDELPAGDGAEDDLLAGVPRVADLESPAPYVPLEPSEAAERDEELTFSEPLADDDELAAPNLDAALEHDDLTVEEKDTDLEDVGFAPSEPIVRKVSDDLEPLEMADSVEDAALDFDDALAAEEADLAEAPPVPAEDEEVAFELEPSLSAELGDDDGAIQFDELAPEPQEGDVLSFGTGDALEEEPVDNVEFGMEFEAAPAAPDDGEEIGIDFGTPVEAEAPVLTAVAAEEPAAEEDAGGKKKKKKEKKKKEPKAATADDGTRKRKPLSTVLSVVLGAVVAIPVALYILMWLGSDFDFLGMGRTLAGYGIPLPAEYSKSTRLAVNPQFNLPPASPETTPPAPANEPAATAPAPETSNAAETTPPAEPAAGPDETAPPASPAEGTPAADTPLATDPSATEAATPAAGAPTEPTTAQPTTAQPTTAQPTTAQPTTAQPTTTEPTPAEPTTAEPAPEEPAPTGPSLAEPSAPAATEPAESPAAMPADAPTPGAREVTAAKPTADAPAAPAEEDPFAPTRETHELPAPADAATPSEPVGPVNAAPVSPAVLAKAIQDAQAADALMTAAQGKTEADVKRARSNFYVSYFRLADAVTFAKDDSGPGQVEALRQSVEQMARQFAADSKRIEALKYNAGRWLAFPRRSTPGVMLAGKVASVQPVGKLQEIKLGIGLDANESLVSVLTDKDPGLSPGDEAFVFGTIVDKPAEQLAGYSGSEPTVVWNGMLVKVSAQP
ncbi:MAG: hypothetical protein AB7O59_11970 [Pirellulales bacterium]